jgi:hypothetical protein
MKENTENKGIQEMNAEEKSNKGMFNTLYSINLQGSTETRDGLTYLTWSKAWKLFKQFYPNSSYRIMKDPVTNLPYYADARTGIMVHTEVSAGSHTYEMMLPVMDNKNRAMRFEPYSYQVLDKSTGAFIEKTVQAATMFDINKAVLRCLVKNIAMFGLGLYLYEGEDYPQNIAMECDEQTDAAAEQQQQATSSSGHLEKAGTHANSTRYQKIKDALNSATDKQAFWKIYWDHKAEILGNPEIKELFNRRKAELGLA